MDFTFQFWQRYWESRRVSGNVQIYFPLKVNGSDTIKWVLLVSINPGGPNGGSATQYFIGDFDGTRFTIDPKFKTELETSIIVFG